MPETMVEVRILMLLCGLLYYHVSGFQKGDWIKNTCFKNTVATIPFIYSSLFWHSS